VTTLHKARRIFKKGLRPGYTTSEMEPTVERFETATEMTRDDPAFWTMTALDHLTREQQTRELFDEVLAEISPKGLPTHDDSIFFWTDRLQAYEYANNMQRKPHNLQKYVVLKVAAKDLPCKCYQADSNDAEFLYDVLWGFSSDDAPTPDEEQWDEIYGYAERYYEGMEVWEGKKDDQLEVLCPCPIPGRVIKGDVPR